MRLAARSGGFTYVGLLLAVAIMAAGLAAIGEIASTAAKRDREAELLFVGDQFARAINEYAAASPGAQQYPPALEDLLADKRYPNVRRHLRRVYSDPITGRPDWVLERGPGGGIIGVHSQSMAKPLKTDNFPKGYESFKGATTYAAWRFDAAAPGGMLGAAAAGKGAGTTVPASPLRTPAQSVAPPAATRPGVPMQR